MIGLLHKWKLFLSRRSSQAFIADMRSRGISIGENVKFFGNLKMVSIDTTRPSLVSIGNDVQIVAPFTILTHGFEWTVFRNKYKEIIGSSGKVVIGNNVYIGKETCILKGTCIGDNVIIGAKSLVNKDIPSDCVAAGVPAKKIMDLDEYFEKRKGEYVEEAREYAYSIYEVFKRLPREEDFYEFFPLFLNRDEESIERFNDKLRLKMKKEGRGMRSLQKQLGHAYETFLRSQPRYGSFEDFLRDAGIPEEEIKKK
jgi:acetyltransferase-like isoleucine patch superfamily enzyme